MTNDKQASDAELIAALREPDPEVSWCGRDGLFEQAADRLEELTRAQQDDGVDCNVVALQSSIDFVVSKEHDELLKKWVMIGHHYFNETSLCKKNDCTSINVLCELGNISVNVDSTHNGSPILSVKQQCEACIDEIQFLATIDRDDAIRLAGLLVAWASEREIHGK